MRLPASCPGAKSSRASTLRFRHRLVAVLTPLYESIHQSDPCSSRSRATTGTRMRLPNFDRRQLAGARGLVSRRHRQCPACLAASLRCKSALSSLVFDLPLPSSPLCEFMHHTATAVSELGCKKVVCTGSTQYGRSVLVDRGRGRKASGDSVCACTSEVRKNSLGQAQRAAGDRLSQEAEIRLEQSFDREGHLILSRNDIWSSVFTPSIRTVFPDDPDYAELWVILGDKPHDARVPERPDADHLVKLKHLLRNDLKRLQNYFSGAPFPWDYSKEEIEEAGAQWIEQMIDLARGK